MTRDTRLVMVVCMAWLLPAAALVHSIITHSAIDTACSGQNSSDEKDVYRSASLKLVYPRLGWFRVPSATPATVSDQLSAIQELRARAPEQVSDACMRAWVVDWLDFYEREARGALAERERLGGYSSQFDKERAELNVRVEELNKRLGVTPIQ